MAWTTQDIDNLKSAIAAGRGAQTIAFSDQTVTFHSIDQMLKLLAVMEQDVNSSTRRNFRVAASNKVGPSC